MPITRHLPKLNRAKESEISSHTAAVSEKTRRVLVGSFGVDSRSQAAGLLLADQRQARTGHYLPFGANGYMTAFALLRDVHIASLRPSCGSDAKKRGHCAMNREGVTVLTQFA
jgi:hypothetical protein